VKYFIQEISLDEQIEVQARPDQCDGCLMPLKESNYLGPIFSLELNDDYYEQFILLPHLRIQDC
jgi:hypothetical protein